MKYLSRLSNTEIRKILEECGLRPVTFNDIPAIKKTNSKILVACIKMDSILYKTILDWNYKQNENGDLILSYIDKSDFESFILLSIDDFGIRIENNNTSNIFLSTENNKLNIKLNSIFLKTMISKFENTNYNIEFNKYFFCQNYQKT